jgi:hypothetical protein
MAVYTACESDGDGGWLFNIYLTRARPLKATGRLGLPTVATSRACPDPCVSEKSEMAG